MFAEEVGDHRRQSLLQLHQVSPTPSHPAGRTGYHPRYILRCRRQTSHNVNYKSNSCGAVNKRICFVPSMANL